MRDETTRADKFGRSGCKAGRGLLRRILVASLALPLLSPEAQAQGAPVKIGVMADFEGIYADIGGKGSVEAARMAIEDFGGQVLGSPIELVSASAQNKADIAANIARGWYDSGTDLIVDLPTSAIAIAISALAAEKKKLAFTTGAGSSDLTGKFCTPYTVNWTWDTYAMAKGTGSSIVKNGGRDWFFLTADYAFGHAMQRDTTAIIEANGGKVLGSVLSPIGTQDFSSPLLTAQGSGAKVLGFANGGNDTTNSIKQAVEFGLRDQMQLVALIGFISDIKSLGIKFAQGLYLTHAFYWDMNDETRAFSKKFEARMGRVPTESNAGAYTAIMHYLKAVKAVGSKEPEKVMAEMRRTPVNDFMTKNGELRPDGRLVRDMYLFQVKKPSESKSEWDLYNVVSTIPGKDAFRSMSEGGCPLVK
jgi:branched-chain amino acid transport system substrate-binding protein